MLHGGVKVHQPHILPLLACQRLLHKIFSYQAVHTINYSILLSAKHLGWKYLLLPLLVKHIGFEPMNLPNASYKLSFQLVRLYKVISLLPAHDLHSYRDIVAILAQISYQLHAINAILMLFNKVRYALLWLRKPALFSLQLEFCITLAP